MDEKSSPGHLPIIDARHYREMTVEKNRPAITAVLTGLPHSAKWLLAVGD